MRLVLAVAALCLAAPASGQPVAAAPVAPTVDAALRADLGLAAAAPLPADWEPPPVLYWAAVGLDVVFLAGGTYLLVQGVRLLAIDPEEAGPGAVVLPLFGTLFAVTGGLAAGFGGYDLVRVARGADPLLVRPFDPTRLPPGATYPPRPPRPPY